LYRSYCSGCTNKEKEIIRSISISSEFTCANTRSKLGFPPHDWDNDFSRVHHVVDEALTSAFEMPPTRA
jgi:hypothetical protein